jgi:fatty-acyl-CoA synthase
VSAAGTTTDAAPAEPAATVIAGSREMPVTPIEFTPSAYHYPLLIKQLLLMSMVTAQDQEIVYRDLRRHSYRDFRNRIGRLASGLADLGVQPGDVVAVMDWDSHRYHECYFAIPMMGAVLQTTNIALSAEQILYTLADTGASTILVNADFLPLLEKLAGRLPNVRRIILLSDRTQPPATTLKIAAEYEALLDGSSPLFQFPDFDENAKATTFHTTGTTGRPKGVYFSHRQIVLMVLAGLTAYGIAPRQMHFHRDDVYMPMTPMFHVHAWGCPYTATTAGAKMVFPGRYTPEVLLRLIQQEGVTFTHCVPTILQMLLNAPGADDVDLSGLKMIVGGSALPSSLARRAMERGIDVACGYGLSEAGPCVTTSHLTTHRLTGDIDEEVGFRTKAGMPGPMVDLRVVTTTMEDVPHDGKTTGEIIARAPWFTMGYLNNPEASEELWAGGYMRTGDMGSIDSEGYLHITDRLKDVIKTGGEWVSSIELEDILLRYEGVSKAAVIAVKDDKWGERPLAVLVLVNAFVEAICSEDIRTYLNAYVSRGEISRFAVPDRVVFVDGLPETSLGKIDKRKLREIYGI